MYILLYSKYSRSCMKLLDSVDQINETMGNTIQIVCIDNKETRKQILNSKSIEIKKVPCLLIVDDNTVEKYDGQRAFEWVSEVIQKINSKSQPPPPPPPKTMIEIEPQKQPPPPPPQQKKKQQKKQPNIEEEESDIEVQSKPKKPPIPIRNEAGSYIIDGSEDEDEEEKEDNDNQEKKSTSGNPNTKGMGVLDLAFAMRQEREKGK